MQRSRAGVVLLAVVMLAGCGVKSQTRRPTDGPTFEPVSGPVCFLTTQLPPTVKATLIGQLVGSKRGYGRTTSILEATADEARKSGANLVTDVVTGHRAGFLAYAEPVAYGNSYRLAEGETIDCEKLGGTLR